jgi:hypothetical protein
MRRLCMLMKTYQAILSLPPAPDSSDRFERIGSAHPATDQERQLWEVSLLAITAGAIVATYPLRALPPSPQLRQVLQEMTLCDDKLP